MRLWLAHGMAETPDQMTDIALSFRPAGSFPLLNVQETEKHRLIRRKKRTLKMDKEIIANLK